MLVTFAVALKHQLRFEPFTYYDDLQANLSHLAILAHDAERLDPIAPSRWTQLGQLLGMPMAKPNPRCFLKNPKKPLGNVPLEILCHCSAYIRSIIDNGTFKAPGYQTNAVSLLSQFNDILCGTDRVLNTPLPVAYSIAISQITWVYILLLPFQLTNYLGWVAIPATLFAAYIMLSITIIGCEIENPFGVDVNDLPLDNFCKQIRQDVDVILYHGPLAPKDFIERDENMLLYPFSNQGHNLLREKSVEEIRMLLRAKLRVKPTED